MEQITLLGCVLGDEFGVHQFRFRPPITDKFVCTADTYFFPNLELCEVALRKIT